MLAGKGVRSAEKTAVKQNECTVKVCTKLRKVLGGLSAKGGEGKNGEGRFGFVRRGACNAARKAKESLGPTGSIYGNEREMCFQNRD